MPKKMLILILFLSLIPIFVTAEPNLIISPNTTSVNSFINYRNPYLFEFRNNGTVDILNVSYTISSDRDFFTFPPIENLSAQTSTTVNISILPLFPYEKDYIIKTEYLYLDYGDYTPQNRTVFITSSGYQPNYLNAKTTDNILFINADSLNHSVREINSAFDSGILEPGMNYSVTYTTPQQIQYYDAGFTGYSAVLNITQATNVVLKHTNSYDRFIYMHVISKYQNGSFNTNLLYRNFTLNYDGYFDNIIEVTNTGTSDLINVRLEADPQYKEWFTWTTTPVYNITALTNKVISFSIRPKLNKTSETNKTHEIDIRIIPENAPSEERELKVFVTYHDYGSTNYGNNTIQVTQLSIDETISLCMMRPEYYGCDRLLNFCLIYPDFGRCKELYKEKIVEVPQKINVSATEIETMVEQAKKMGDIAERQNNNRNVVDDSINELRNNYNSLVTIQRNYTASMEQHVADDIKKAKSERNWGIFWNIMKFLFWLFVGIFYLIRYLYARGVRFKEIRQSPND